MNNRWFKELVFIYLFLFFPPLNKVRRLVIVWGKFFSAFVYETSRLLLRNATVDARLLREHIQGRSFQIWRSAWNFRLWAKKYLVHFVRSFIEGKSKSKNSAVCRETSIISINYKFLVNFLLTYHYGRRQRNIGVFCWSILKFCLTGKKLLYILTMEFLIKILCYSYAKK